MAIILGLDIATTTGFAWYDERVQSLSAIKAGTFKAEGDGILKAPSFARQFIALIKNNRPDFVAIEAPFAFVAEHEKEVQTLHGTVTQSTVNPTSTDPKALAWVAVGILNGGYNIPFEMIDQKTWRSCWFGKGFKPPVKMLKVNGKLRPKKDWKTAAVERARALHIAVSKADAAEAVGIAFSGASTQTFKMLEARRAA